MSLSAHVLHFLQAQTEGNFLALRQEIATVPGFSRYASYEAVGFALVEQQKLTEALAALKAMMPGSFLSPGLHNLLAFIQTKLNNGEEAGKESYLATAVMRSILATGDGSEARPYLVLQVSDEYDVLKVLGKESAAQGLHWRQERVLDRHECTDESILWFDVTTPQAEQRPNA
jgi:hypothetical protein